LYGLVALAIAEIASPAAAQPVGDGAFAAYAIEFCAAVVDGVAPADAAARASPGAVWSGPAPLGDDVDLVGRELDADRDTPVVILGPPGNPPRPIMAFARADATRCMTFDGEREDGVAALTERLAAADGPWHREIATERITVYDRNASAENGVVRLQVLPGDRGQAARAIAIRNAGRVVRLTPTAARAWADAIIGACVGAVHQGRDVEPEALAPHYVRGERYGAANPILDSTPGQPQGVTLINTRDGACFVTVLRGNKDALRAAVLDSLAASGARAGGRDNHFILPKPDGADGRDALIIATPATALLAISVRRR
jgi:hypothetical protein